MAEQGEQRRLAAILAIDMVGYSRLMETDERGTIAREKAHRTELIDPKIAEHRGRVVKLMGDGMLAEFGSVVDAVECAVAIQRAMMEREAEVPDDRRIQYRVGINLGDIVIVGDDILGEGINVAARLEGLAEPGGICISRTARDQVRDKLGVGLEDLGEIEVKNITRPVRAFKVLLDETAKPAPARTPRGWIGGRSAIAAAILVVVVVAGGALWWQPWAPKVPSQEIEAGALALPSKPSIAVLAFKNLSGDPSQEHFSDGVTENIIDGLSRFKSFFVIARNSSFTYKGKAIDIKRIGRELGVRYVLEGSIQRSGNQVRVTVQMIGAATGQLIWADRYDRELKDIFAVQDAITQGIISTVAPEIAAAEYRRVLRKEPQNLDAWDLTLRARWQMVYGRIDQNSVEEAMLLLDQAIELDPTLADSYTQLGFAHTLNVFLGWSRSVPDSISAAAQSFAKALELDPSDAFAIAAQARVFLLQRRHDEAIDSATRSIGLNPNSAYGHPSC